MEANEIIQRICEGEQFRLERENGFNLITGLPLAGLRVTIPNAKGSYTRKSSFWLTGESTEQVLRDFASLISQGQ